MATRKFKVKVELGESRGSSWSSSTSKQFDVVIEAAFPQQAESIALSQYGGSEKCKIRGVVEVR